MFKSVKLAAAQAVIQGLFSSTMHAVRKAPASVQIAIAQATQPEIDGFGTVPGDAFRHAVAFKLKVFTAKRQFAVLKGADDEADPEWASAALMESWCSAALIDARMHLDIHQELINWQKEVLARAAQRPAPTASSPPPSTPAFVLPASEERGPAAHPAIAELRTVPAHVPVKPRRNFGCDACGNVVDLNQEHVCRKARCPASAVR